jgi:hypothetical protein
VALRVDQAVVGDREHPRPKPGVVALELPDITRDLEERLAEGVLGVRDVASPEVSEHDRRQVRVDLRPGALVAHLGGVEERGEAVGSHPDERKP